MFAVETNQFGTKIWSDIKKGRKLSNPEHESNMENQCFALCKSRTRHFVTQIQLVPIFFIWIFKLNQRQHSLIIRNIILVPSKLSWDAVFIVLQIQCVFSQPLFIHQSVVFCLLKISLWKYRVQVDKPTYSVLQLNSLARSADASKERPVQKGWTVSS